MLEAARADASIPPSILVVEDERVVAMDLRPVHCAPSHHRRPVPPAGSGYQPGACGCVVGVLTR